MDHKGCEAAADGNTLLETAPGLSGPFLFSKPVTELLGSVNPVSNTRQEISGRQDQIRDQENDEAAVNVWDIEMRVMND